MAPPVEKEEIILPDTTQDDDEDDDHLVGLRAFQPSVPENLENNEIDVIDIDTIVDHINDCLLPKLAKNYDETGTHPEFHMRNNNLERRVNIVIEEFEKYAFRIFLDIDASDADKQNAVEIVAALLNLYKELLCNCSWNGEISRECARTLDECFNEKCHMRLEDIMNNNDVCNSQAVYDRILDDLCQKLTSNNFKKYPGQIEVYCDLVLNFKDYDVVVNPIKILPAALILIDDYIESNKCKGLLCCQVLLNELSSMDFENGNYYDVIYLSIKNALNHKDLKVTELTHGCALELCHILPAKIKDDKVEEMYAAALDQLNTESNLYRKAAFFKYTKKLIEMLEIKCVGKGIFKTIVCDTVEYCLTDSVADILLIPSLECLEEWIKHCWPTWKLALDHKLLCALLKYYSKCKSGEGGLLVQKLIVTLISLCSSEEQKQFTAQLGGKGDEDNTKKGGVKKDIGLNTKV